MVEADETYIGTAVGAKRGRKFGVTDHKTRPLGLSNVR